MHPYKLSALICAPVVLAMLAGCGETPTPTAVDQPESPPAVEIAADRATVEISNAMSGWLQTGLEVSAGDGVALFGKGEWLADGLTMEPRHMLWYRVGEDGAARNFAANQEAFTAEADGELFVTLRPLGVYWPDTRGTYSPSFSQAPAIPVQISIDVLRFNAPIETGLTALAEANDPNAAAALDTLSERKTLPEGFDYLPFLARSNVWATGTVDGRRGIQAQTSDDVGIVKLPLDIPLTEDTRFSFEWRYDALPALGPETEAQFHDYLSIALEFDNGQDLTWMRSPELEVGTHFGCPLPWWDSRETHYVLTSGRENLGTWEQHTRPVLADYRESIDVAEPARIVGIWFIANSLFGRQEASASFANVHIENGDTQTVIFAD